MGVWPVVLLFCLSFTDFGTSKRSGFNFLSNIETADPKEIKDAYRKCYAELYGYDRKIKYPSFVELDEFDVLSLNNSHGNKRPLTELRKIKTWPNARIPTVIGKMTEFEKKRLDCAGLYFAAYTCLKFVHKRPSDTDYLSITFDVPKVRSHLKCYSEEIGVKGGRQVVNLDPSSTRCWKHGVIIHELMHAIGFFHEQSRNDRNKHINVHWKNIDPDFHLQFKTAEEHGIELLLPTGEYDYHSLMHYGRYQLGSEPSMSATGDTDAQSVAHGQMGNRDKPSRLDQKKINHIYCPNANAAVSMSARVIVDN